MNHEIRISPVTKSPWERCAVEFQQKSIGFTFASQLFLKHSSTAVSQITKTCAFQVRCDGLRSFQKTLLAVSQHISVRGQGVFMPPVSRSVLDWSEINDRHLSVLSIWSEEAQTGLSTHTHSNVATCEKRRRENVSSYEQIGGLLHAQIQWNL